MGHDYVGGWQEASLTRDISLGGCYVVAERPYPIGEIFEFDFKIPFGDKQISFIGEVTRVEPSSGKGKDQYFGHGISFMKIKEKDKHKKDMFEKNLQEIIRRAAKD